MKIIKIHVERKKYKKRIIKSMHAYAALSFFLIFEHHEIKE